MKTTLALLLTAFVLVSSVFAQTTETRTVLPANHVKMIDDSTGAALTFLSQHHGDRAFYFHVNSFLVDGSIVLYLSREHGIAGYLWETGERVVFNLTGGSTSATASQLKPVFYGARNGSILEITPHVVVSKNPTETPSVVTVTERIIADSLGGGEISLNSDGTLLTTYRDRKIHTINVATGEVRAAYTVEDSIGWHGHLQWSRTNPDLLSFAGEPNRLQVVNVREGRRWVPYHEIENELVTHESWWVDDQILFCGAPRPYNQDQSHVKVVDPHTGVVRIIGNGAWWPGATPSELARFNWWHSSGSWDGRWALGDNWHGDIMLFEGETTRPRLLTTGHRIYGSGTHPEPGWSFDGTKVAFSSDWFGKKTSLPCVVEIPEDW
jgi:hypothetical protein